MRSRPYRPWLAVVAVLAASALGILGLPAAAFAQSPAVTYSPSSGPVGTSFTITGSHWMPGGKVTSTLPYGSPGWFTGYQAPTVDANGKFSYTETVGTGPGGPTPSGTYTLTYVENYHGSSLSATQTFTVTLSIIDQYMQWLKQAGDTESKFIAWLTMCVEGNPRLSEVDPGCKDAAYELAKVKLTATNLVSCAADIKNPKELGICLGQSGVAIIMQAWEWWKVHGMPSKPTS